MQEALSFQNKDVASIGVETYSQESGRLRHEVDMSQAVFESRVTFEDASADPKGAWWSAYLEGRVPTPARSRGDTARVADLFCGPGGLANGMAQLTHELGTSLISELAVDQDLGATQVYAANHDTRVTSTDSVANLVDFRVRGEGSAARFSYEPELILGTALPSHPRVDVVMAGPPCQGHSNLNNHTRRDDRRNALYLTVPAFAVASGASIAIIENVPDVVYDAGQVVEATTRLFEDSGYEVTSGVLSAGDMGWPQQRRRHFLVARRDKTPIAIADIGELLRDSQKRSVWWAIADLEDVVGDSPMDQVTELSDENQRRIDWLFENDEYDLALSERPESHRNGTSYMSVYGRMNRDEPAQTITTGFMSPGRGRYVHPTRRRVMTPREAARLQGFPDTYRFVVDESNPPTRASLAKWIGDAVPMPLGYAAALSALGPGPVD